MFTRIRHTNWTLSVDAAATRAIMAGPDFPPGAEGCGCSTCNNFLAQRESVYSPDLLALFEALGLDWRCEVEVVHYCRLANGRHMYGAWFHLVGTIEEGPEAWTVTGPGSSSWDVQVKTDVERCALGFSSQRILVDSGFTGLPVVQLDLSFELPWVTDEPEPT